MELAVYEEIKLTPIIRRKAEKIISSYKKVSALIQTLQMDLPSVKLTPTYELKEGSCSGVSNTIESLYLKQEHIEEEVAKNTMIKRKLDIIYDSLNETQKTIWDEKYLNGRFDDAILDTLRIRRANYFNEKNEMILLVARAFCLM